MTKTWRGAASFLHCFLEFYQNKHSCLISIRNMNRRWHHQEDFHLPPQPLQYIRGN